MSSLKKNFTVVSLLFSLLFIRCEHDDKTSCRETICTMEYRTIVISLKHEKDNSPFVLSNYKVTRVSDGSDLTVSNDLFPGYYAVATDSQLDLFKFKNVELEFTGYLNGVIVIQKYLVITADCCHISKVSGETEFYL